MRLAAVALTVSALLLGAAQPVAAASPVDLKAAPGTVVVGSGGAGVWTTFSATGADDAIRAMDLDLYGPDGEKSMIDLVVRNRPGVWEGQYKFNRFDAAGRWKAVLIMRDEAGHSSSGGTLYFRVKRRTTLTTVSSQSRGGGISGVLRRLAANGSYQPYARQRVRLYRWNGSWTYEAADITDAKGRYAFKARSGKLQIRYAGTSIDAASVRNAN